MAVLAQHKRTVLFRVVKVAVSEPVGRGIHAADHIHGFVVIVVLAVFFAVDVP